MCRSAGGARAVRQPFRLRGLVSARGKLTTIWADLKAQKIKEFIIMKTLIVNRKITLSIFAVLLLTCCIQGISYAQDEPDDTLVEFADVNLATAIREKLGLDTGEGR